MPFESRGNESKRYGYIPLRVENCTKRIYVGRESEPAAQIAMRAHRLTSAGRAARRAALDKALSDQKHMEPVLDLLVDYALLWRRGALLAVPHLLERPKQPPTVLSDDLISLDRSAVQMNAPVRDIYKLLRDAEKNIPGTKEMLERLQKRYAEAYSAGCDMVMIARDLRVKSLADDSKIAQAALQDQFDAAIATVRSDSTDDPVDYLMTEITAVLLIDLLHCQMCKGRVGVDLRDAEGWDRLVVKSQERFDVALESLLRYRKLMRQQS